MICVDILQRPTLFSDTWVTGQEVADIEVVVVDERARGQGIGTALLRAVDDRLRDRGIPDQFLGAIEPNHQAIQLYQRLGFRPAWLELTRRTGIPPTAMRMSYIPHVGMTLIRN